jgi:ribosomal protein S18 acetylase RimI-like enzyme
MCRMTKVLSFSDIRLELAHEEDMDCIVTILQAAAAWLESKGIEQWQWPNQFSRVRIANEVQNGQFWVARCHNEVIGTFKLQDTDPVFWPEDGVAALYLHSLAIDRRFAGCGLGRELLRRAEFMAAARNKEFLRLDCMAENPILCEYYRHAGFEPCGHVQGQGWSSEKFQKRVNDCSQEPSNDVDYRS